MGKENEKGKGELVAVRKPTIGEQKLNQFFVQFDNSAYVVSDDEHQLALQSFKLNLEADMQVTMNFIYHIESLQKDSPRTPLIFKDALVLMLHQLYALRRDSLAELTYRATHNILMEMRKCITNMTLHLVLYKKTGTEYKDGEDNWQNWIGLSQGFANQIERYFFVEDFPELVSFLRNQISFKKIEELVDAIVNEDEKKEQELKQEIVQFHNNKALKCRLKMENRNNPIVIRKKIVELKNNKKWVMREFEVFNKIYSVDALIDLTEKYISAYEHYLRVMDNIRNLITLAGENQDLFRNYINAVNQAIMTNKDAYVIALIIETENQKIRLNSMSTSHSNMRKLLTNRLELNMNLIYNYLCQLADQDGKTLSDFLHENLVPTKQLSIMVLEAQNRVLVTGYSPQRELKVPAQEHENGEDDVVIVEEVDGDAPPSHGGSSKSNEGQLVLVDNSDRQIQSRVKEHQEQFKQAQEQHAIHEQSVESARNGLAVAQTYQQAYAQIAAYWQGRGAIGGYFARIKQTAFQEQYGCIDESNPKDLKKHTQAKTIFDAQLKNTSSVADIAALWNVAEPFINRHRNDFRDIFFSVNHTSSWRDKMQDARSKAYDLLKQEAKSIGNLKERKTYYMQWRNHPLFAEHRRDSVFTGAWGRTSTKVKIVNKIEKCDKEIAKASVKKL